VKFTATGTAEIKVNVKYCRNGCSGGCADEESSTKTIVVQ
jgi:hypothetical protein